MGALRPANTGTSEGEAAAEPEAREAREMQAQKYPALHVTVRTPFAMIPANKGQLSLRRSQLGTAPADAREGEKRDKGRKAD